MFHQAERLGHDDHEGGRDGGETGGDDGRLAHRVLTGGKHPIRDEQAHRVAADKGGHRVNGRVARGAPQGAHHRLHQHSDELEQAETEQEGEQHGAERHYEANRQGQLVKQEGQTIRRHQPGGPRACHVEQRQREAEQLEQGQQPVDEAATPAAVKKGASGAIGDQRQDQTYGQGSLPHQGAGQVIHQYSAAPRQLERHEEGADAKHAGEQQLETGAATRGRVESVFRFHDFLPE